jgi:hypothetical protein
VCARNRKIGKGRLAGVRYAAQWAGEKLRTGLLAIGVRGGALIAMAVAAVWGLSLAQRAVGQKPKYRVYPAHFRAEAPSWCADDLARVEFPRESYSIFDPDLTREVAEAYTKSCWVEAVRRVEKHLPNKLIVQLDLRQPAAFVRLASGYAAVDESGIYLPLEYNRWDHQARPLPRVYGVEAEPPAPGAVWSEPHVAAATAVLRVLAAEPRILQQIGIVDVTNLHGEINRRESEINLFTRRWGHRVVVRWGASPDDAKSMEPRPREKLQALRRCLQKSLSGGSSIDLRFPNSGTLARH